MADEFDVFKAEMLKNPAVKAEYDALEPECQFISQLIDTRTESKKTQKQLAEKIGTK